MKPSDLTTYRNRLGLSQLALAAKLKVSRATVNRWENGQTEIPYYLELALRSIESDAYHATQ